MARMGLDGAAIADALAPSAVLEVDEARLRVRRTTPYVPKA